MSNETMTLIQLLNNIFFTDRGVCASLIEWAHAHLDRAGLLETDPEATGNPSQLLVSRLGDAGGEANSLYWEVYEEAVDRLAALPPRPVRREERSDRGHSERRNDSRQPPRDAISALPEQRRRTQQEVAKKFNFARLVMRESEFAEEKVVPEMERRLGRLGFILPSASSVPYRLTALEELFEDMKPQDWDTAWMVVTKCVTDVLDGDGLSNPDKREAMRKAHAEAERKRQAEAEAERKRQAEAEAERKRQAEAEAERKRKADRQEALERQLAGLDPAEAEAKRLAVLAKVALAAAEPPKRDDTNRGSSTGNGIKGLKTCTACGATVLATAKFCAECGHSFVAAAPPPPPAPAPVVLDAATSDEINAMLAKIEEDERKDKEVTPVVAAEPTEEEDEEEADAAEEHAALAAEASGKPVQGKGESMKLYRKRLAAWAEKL